MVSSDYRRLSAWPSGLDRAPSCFIAHELGVSRVQTPGADTVNQAVDPSGVGELEATSMQWVTAVEDCEGKACGCTMADVRLQMLPAAQTTVRWFRAIRTGL
jgi:hypothetical protein